MQAFVDMECYLWSTVLADSTPMISTGMVLCDRHHGGINYPVGGVGEISRLLVQGLEVRLQPTSVLPNTFAMFLAFSWLSRSRRDRGALLAGRIRVMRCGGCC